MFLCISTFPVLKKKKKIDWRWLHDIDKHFTRVPHSYLKWLSTTGNVFGLGCRHLRPAALVRTVGAAVAVSAGHRQGWAWSQRRQVAVWGAAVARRRVLQMIRSIRWTAFMDKKSNLLNEGWQQRWLTRFKK